MKSWRRFGPDRSGGVAVVTALTMPLLFGIVAVGIDYSVAVHDRTVLQNASDATALSLARELTLARPDNGRIRSLGEIVAKQHLQSYKLDTDAVVSAEVSDQGSRVRVAISRPRRVMMSPFGIGEGSIETDASASVSGPRRICVIALDGSGAQTLHLKSNSQLSAERCDVYSNSVSPAGIESDSGIQVSASRTCSSGGFSGAGRFSGEKVSDCPPVKDPLIGRPIAPATACSHTNLRVIDKGRGEARHILTPGTYCGGLFIGGNSFVQFQPGTYVVKDGPLTVDSNADVRGIHVGFALVGKEAVYRFLSNAKVWLDAPRDGPLAGILFFEDRAAEPGRLHEIKSNFVSNLTGTIYLPRGKFVVDATNDVSQRSAFTIIVAQQILLTANPRLVLNTDYALTDVPVPAGLGRVGGPVRLVD